MRKNWDEKDFMEVVFLQEGPGIRKYEYEEAGYPMINVRCVQDGFIDMSKSRSANMVLATSKWKHFQIDEGDILFTISGTIGRAAIVKKSDLPLLMNTSVVRFKSISESLTKDFLYRYVSSSIFVDKLKGMSTGTAIQNVGPSHLKKMTVPIPPIEEQKQIVAILDKTFTAIDQAKANIEKNIENAKELFENKLQKLFNNKDWEQKNLGEIASFKNGMNFTKSSKGQSIEIVGVKNFKNNFWVPFQELENVILDGEMSEAYQLKKGDIITVRSNGNPKLIGRTLLSDEVSGNISHSGFTIRIRLNSNTILPIFLCHYLKTAKTRKELVDSGNGVGIKSLNQGSLSSLMVPFPQSEKEQKLIVNKIEEVSKKAKKLEAIYFKKLEDLDELKKSILQKAFAGELTQKAVAV